LQLQVSFAKENKFLSQSLGDMKEEIECEESAEKCQALETKYNATKY
jgi:hypothetical protein